MKEARTWTLLLLVAPAVGSCAGVGGDASWQSWKLELPTWIPQPGGCVVSPTGDLIVSVGVAGEKGRYQLIRVTPNLTASEFLDFSRSAQVGARGVVPWGLAFGPDGNLYVADNPHPDAADPPSRLIRVRMKGGQPAATEVVVTGFTAATAVAWRGGRCYVSEGLLRAPGATGRGETSESGIYVFTREELSGPAPVQLLPGSPQEAHLLTTLRRRVRTRLGAGSLAFDAGGNLYCANIGDGTVHQIRLGPDDRPTSNGLWAQAVGMKAANGLVYDASDGCLYIADSVASAVHRIDARGAVRTLSAGPGTGTPVLLQPCGIALQGRRLVVFDGGRSGRAVALSP